VYELICEKGKLKELAAEMPEEMAGMQELLEVYNKGVDIYYGERDFRKALGYFEKAVEFEPNKRINPAKPTPSGRFIEMCKKYIENPPGDDWDGVNRLTSK